MERKEKIKTPSFRRCAVEQGLAEAQNHLGVTCHNGNGVPQSPWEVYVWHSIENLAKKGQAEAVRRAEWRLF